MGHFFLSVAVVSRWPSDDRSVQQCGAKCMRMLSTSFCKTPCGRKSGRSCGQKKQLGSFYNRALSSRVSLQTSMAPLCSGHAFICFHCVVSFSLTVGE